MDVLEPLSMMPVLLAEIVAGVPESLVRVRSGPFALVEQLWHLADLVPAHPLIPRLRSLAAGGPRSSKAA